jgi:hypothetical protein
MDMRYMIYAAKPLDKELMTNSVLRFGADIDSFRQEAHIGRRSIHAEGPRQPLETAMGLNYTFETQRLCVSVFYRCVLFLFQSIVLKMSSGAEATAASCLRN